MTAGDPTDVAPDTFLQNHGEYGTRTAGSWAWGPDPLNGGDFEDPQVLIDTRPGHGDPRFLLAVSDSDAQRATLDPRSNPLSSRIAGGHRPMSAAIDLRPGAEGLAGGSSRIRARRSSPTSSSCR